MKYFDIETPVKPASKGLYINFKYGLLGYKISVYENRI